MATPEERRDKLEELLTLAGEDQQFRAMGLMLLRWSSLSNKDVPAYDVYGGKLNPGFKIGATRREKFDSAYGDVRPYPNHHDILDNWGYKRGSWWPIRDPERAVYLAYESFDQIIQDALALGYIEAAAKISRLWEASK